MRIVMLLGRSTGGIGTHVVDLVAGLRRAGDDVVVVTDRLTADRFGLDDAEVWWPDPSRPGRSLRNLRSLRRLLKAADVVHAHGHQAGLVAVLAVGGLRTRPALVVSLHNAVLRGPGRGVPGRRGSRQDRSGAGPRGRLLSAVERHVARSADLITGASSDLADRARALGARRVELAPVPSPRVPRLLESEPVAVEERERAADTLLTRSGIGSTGPLVLTVSRIAPQKDLGTLLDAAEALTCPVTWCVLGDGDEALAGELRSEAVTRRLPVHLVGPVPDPTEWVRAASVFVLTSTWEARALVVQEALAAGTPVVATDTGGLHDLVEGVGRLVPVGDATAVAAAVEDYLRDPGSRHTAGTAGRVRARTWEDGPAAARRWRAWYETLRR